MYSPYTCTPLARQNNARIGAGTRGLEDHRDG